MDTPFQEPKIMATKPSMPKRLKIIQITTLISVIISLIITLILDTQLADSHALNEVAQSSRDSYNNHHQDASNRRQFARSGLTNGLPDQNRCQTGWMWLNNKCWVSTKSMRDFLHAIDLCKKQFNATLPTIHSEVENEFLRQNIDLHNGPIWLYAKHNHEYNKTAWLDKSKVNYTKWDAGQPSDRSTIVCFKKDENWYMRKAEKVDGQTECVSFWEDAKWGTNVGCQVLLPVVCERKLTPITSRYSDGSNGTISNQYEQLYSVSAASSFNGQLSMTTYLIAIAGTLTSMALSNSPLTTIYKIQ